MPSSFSRNTHAVACCAERRAFYREKRTAPRFHREKKTCVRDVENAGSFLALGASRGERQVAGTRCPIIFSILRFARRAKGPSFLAGITSGRSGDGRARRRDDAEVEPRRRRLRRGAARWVTINEFRSGNATHEVAASPSLSADSRRRATSPKILVARARVRFFLAAGACTRGDIEFLGRAWDPRLGAANVDG